ncbi:hypothetical protein GJ496_003419 [Pomphorhynchus laevis]|nr:hypothetical protein GJ496_003419 [Pomphorhynchus laevis]
MAISNVWMLNASNKSVKCLIYHNLNENKLIDDVVYRNIDACIELSKLTNSSFGPCGLTKFVINHFNKLYTTSDAAAIIHELEVQHPAAKLLSMASEQQDREVGDSTNLGMYSVTLQSRLLFHSPDFFTIVLQN